MSFLRRTGRYFWTLLTNLYFWAGLVLLVLLALGAYILIDEVVMPTYTRYGVSVTVPEVTGVEADRARDQLAERDLRAQTLEKTFNPDAERGAVIDQNPAGGKAVKPGRRVYLTVNTGEQPVVAVPRVVDASLREAKSQLRAFGFTVGQVREDSIPSPYEGTVTRQRPAAGDSLPKGASVSLWYSGGLSEQTATVPDVTGLTVEEARRQLRGRKLRTVVVRTGDGEGDDGDEAAGAQPSPSDADRQDLSGMEVVRQSRAPDTRVRQGFEVRLFVGG
jgi:beta-lactam-binding protein with PASTA domain